MTDSDSNYFKSSKNTSEFPWLETQSDWVSLPRPSSGWCRRRPDYSPMTCPARTVYPDLRSLVSAELRADIRTRIPADPPERFPSPSSCWRCPGWRSPAGWGTPSAGTWCPLCPSAAGRWSRLTLSREHDEYPQIVIRPLYRAGGKKYSTFFIY